MQFSCSVTFRPLYFVCAAAIVALNATVVHADDRRFVFTDESRHHPPTGDFEFEQAITWRSHTPEDSKFERIDFRHEIEYGFTDTIQLAVDLAEWHWQKDEEGHETIYDATAAEIRIRFMDPVTDAIGLGYKAEVGIGRESLEWENVFIVDKVFDKLEVAYNFVIEPSWEGQKYFKYDAHGIEFANRLGVSYELSPSWFVGAEFIHEVPLPDYKSGEKQNCFLGPNFSYRGHNWAVTTTALFLLTGGEDEAEFTLRTIFEIDF